MLTTSRFLNVTGTNGRRYQIIEGRHIRGWYVDVFHRGELIDERPYLTREAACRAIARCEQRDSTRLTY